MKRVLKSVSASKSELIAFLADQLDAIEPGLELVDREFEIVEPLAVDLLAADAERRPVLIDVSAQPDPAQLLRALELFDVFVRHKTALARSFPEETLSFTEPPRLVLVAPEHPRALIEGLRHLGFTDVALVTARAYQQDETAETGVVVECVARSERAEARSKAVARLRAALDDVPITEDELAAFAEIEARRLTRTR